MRVFIDTMIYLHYQWLEDIDLPSLLGDQEISIVVPRITLRELDKHKNTHSSGKVKDRAHRVLQKIEQWVNKGGGPRVGVDVEFFATMPAGDLARHGLNPAWNDDLLVATILKYKELHPADDVCLLTQDSGPRLTAELLGVAVLSLPEDYRLPAETDPLETENRELKKSLDRLRNAQPRLEARVLGGEVGSTFTRFRLSAPPAPLGDEVDRRIAELRMALSKVRPAAPRLGPAGIALGSAAWLASLGSMDPILPEEYDRYDQDLANYLLKYADFMRRTWEHEAATLCSIRFQIEIRNMGTAPAEDVDVELHFPDGFRLFSKDNLPQPPAEPQSPQEPRTKLQMALGGMPQLPGIYLPSSRVPRFEPPTSFEIRRTGSYTVKDRFLRIKHATSVALPALTLVFDSHEDARSFACHWTMRLANLPDAVEGDLHFVIEK